MRLTSLLLCLVMGMASLLFSSEASAKKLHPQRPQAPEQAAHTTAAPQKAQAPDVQHLTEASSPRSEGLPIWVRRLIGLLIGLAGGGLLGALLSQRLRELRRHLLFGFLGMLAVWLVVTALTFSDATSYAIGGIAGAVIAWLLLRVQDESTDTTLGSAKWADLRELTARGVVATGKRDFGEQSAPRAAATGSHINMATAAAQSAEGLFLGCFQGKKGLKRLYYKGDRHALTIAPNRSGKGTTAIVPNLLSYLGSSIVIDVKGENAKVTALHRGPGTSTVAGLGQNVFILDPWNIAKVPGICPAKFNPIDWVIGDAANAVENAMLLAESIVTERGAKEPFWDDEARALLMGLLLYLAFDPAEEGQRHLGRLRDIIVMGEDDLAVVLANMLRSASPVVRSTASRTVSKEVKLLSNVFTTLQAHTHFLDSPVLRESLKASDFDLANLKTQAMTVYVVLPADKLDTFGRWLRLVIQQAVAVNVRNLDDIPERPVLMILDEMAALGKLGMVERAFGLMAGFGIQLWGIFQDASQAERIYGQGWQTFVGNAGVLQYFGSLDEKSSRFMSSLCGVTTMVKFSLTGAIVAPFTFMGRLMGLTSELKPQSQTKDIVQRQLAYPDELMRMRHPDQLLFIEGCNPIMAKKLAWFDDPERHHLGVNLHAKEPIPTGARPALKAHPIPAHGAVPAAA